MVEKLDQKLFGRLMAILSLADPPSDEDLANPQAIACGAVLPVWLEMPYSVLVVARMYGIEAARVVLCALQAADPSKLWWPQLNTVCRYAQSLQALALIRSLSVEDGECITAHAEASFNEEIFLEELKHMNPKFAVLYDLHRSFGLGGLDQALSDLQDKIAAQERQLPDIIQRLVDAVPVPVVA
jgi:hypothetical protein